MFLVIAPLITYVKDSFVASFRYYISFTHGVMAVFCGSKQHMKIRGNIIIKPLWFHYHISAGTALQLCFILQNRISLWGILDNTSFLSGYQNIIPYVIHYTLKLCMICVQINFLDKHSIETYRYYTIKIN